MADKVVVFECHLIEGGVGLDKVLSVLAYFVIDRIGMRDVTLRAVGYL